MLTFVALECVTLFRFLKVNALVIDFDQSRLSLPIQKELGQWVVRYFDQLQNSLCIPPLYLQWHGHSVTVVGYERKQEVVSFLVFDPAKDPTQIQSALDLKKGWQKYLKRGIHTFKQDKYQIVCILPNSSSYSFYEDKVIRGLKPSDVIPI